MAFHSLLANRWKASMRSASKRTSWLPVPTAAAQARTASAPYRSTISSGSTTFPFDLLIRDPSAAWMMLVIITWLNGFFWVNFRPVMIMRATQRKMMSRPVTSTSVG